MTLPLFSLGPLWTKHPPNGVLPVTIETIIGYETSSYATSPLSSQGLISCAQNMLFLCRSGGVAGSNIWVSADQGESWTSILMPATLKWLYVAWTGTMYIAVTAGTTSQADKFAYSNDGYHWTLVGSFTNIFRRVGVQTNGTGGYIVPAFNAGAVYQYTLDGGFTWVTGTAPASPGSGSFYHFASDGQGTVIGVKSSGGTTYMRSIDSGVTFNLTTFPASMTADGTPIKISWDSGVYWVQTTATRFWVSDDGSNWVVVNIATSTSASVIGGGVFSWARGILDYGNSTSSPTFYLARRSSATDVNTPVADTLYGIPSSAAPLPRDLNSEAIYSFDFTQFVPFRSTKLNSYKASFTGLTGQDPGQLFQVASNGAGLIVGLNAGNGTRSWTSTDDGQTWTVHNNVFPNSPNTTNTWWIGLIWDGTYFIAVADYYQTLPTFCRHYYSTDGVNWTQGSDVFPNFLGTWALVVPRYGGGAILMVTPTSGGGPPYWLPSATGTWTAGTSTTYNSGSFSAWRGLNGDGAGNYVVCRKGESVPNNPAIGWSSDNGVSWNYYEMTALTDVRLKQVNWDGNQWIIMGAPGNTGGNGIIILTSDVTNPSSPSDWKIYSNFNYSSTGNGIKDGVAPSFQKAFSDGLGRTYALTTLPTETTEGVTWAIRNFTPYNSGTTLVANLGPRAGYRNRFYSRTDTSTGGSYSNRYYDTPMYPYVVFGETANGSLTGRAVSRRALFMSELSTLGLSTANYDFESLSAGSVTSSTPLDIVFNSTPNINAKLRVKTAGSISAASSLTFNTTVSGSKYMLANDHVIIDFSIPVSAVGFYVSNAPRYSVTGSGNSTDRLRVTTTSSLGLTQTFKVAVYDLTARAGSLAFWGVVDHDRKIVSVRIQPDNPAASSYGIDDVVIGVDTATAPAYDSTLVADFITTPTSGSAPLITQFEDTSGPHIPIAWWWDFNDDGYNERLDRISTPRYTFFEGTYTVRLMVRWLNGQFGTIVKPANVTSNAVVPVANFAGSPLTGVAPLTVQFIDSSSNFPTSWAWDFENNGSVDSTAQNPSFVYSTAGTYTVKLTTSNGAGSNSLTRTAYVTATQPAPVASFTASPTSGVAPLTVNFTDTSTNSPTSWAWDFENNGSVDSTAQNPSFVYSTAGTYTAKLTATNVGGSNSTTQVISVGGGGSVGPMTFEEITTDYADAYQYYNGGFDDNFVDGPGPAYGVIWSGALVRGATGAHSPTRAAGTFFPGDFIYMNYAAGFITSISFWIMADGPITIKTYSGQFASGSVLNVVTGTYGSLSGGTMVQVTVPAAGLAKSVSFGDEATFSTSFFIDDVVINL